MPDEPIAVVLCRATNRWPEVTSDYKVFITNLLAEFDSLSEVQWNQVSEDARKWAMNAIDAVNNDNPVEECPGFEDVFDVEDRTPMFTEDSNEVEVETTDSKGKKVRKPRVARGAKKDDTKAGKKGRAARPVGEGKTYQLMEAIYNNPKMKLEDLEALELSTKPYTRVVHSFYTSAIKHLKTKGVKIDLEF